jgi:OPT oligopeptide transporter protein
MKLGHYMKVPPRTMFWCQVVATIVAGTVQLVVQEWYVPCFTSQTGGPMTVLGQDVRQHNGHLRAATT